MNSEKHKKITQFLFEMGTMRKLPRIHRQVLLTDDVSDTIASHSYRVTLIGWFLAKLEGADPYKVVMMCLSHDMSEVRAGDHNWIHKRYVKIFDEEIRNEQLGGLPFQELREIAGEYDKRESKESIVAKDADILDQIFLLKEYAWQGNKEAQIWLDRNEIIYRCKTESGTQIAKAIMEEAPSSWADNLATGENR